ncbi:MAG: hypothetical protein IPK78_07845 [Rhodospirillales bacterium]|nr:hypothetical protein [Rhodospirillales bacterium]
MDIYIFGGSGTENGKNLYCGTTATARSKRSNRGRCPSPRAVIRPLATVADFDVDGRVDILLTFRRAPREYSTLPQHWQLKENHWLEIDLQGTTSNRDALGAKVFVTAGGNHPQGAQNGASTSNGVRMINSRISDSRQTP